MKTLAKALKEKKKLTQEISQLQKRLTNYNSVIKGNPRPFEMDSVDKELVAKTEELILLKSVITKANQPVQDKIYRMSELKGLIAFYKKYLLQKGSKLNIILMTPRNMKYFLMKLKLP
jgi:hypothetical protein